MADLPETDNPVVMRMAVAWSIVNQVSFGLLEDASNAESGRKKLTDAYTQTYNALLANERGETPESDS